MAVRLDISVFSRQARHKNKLPLRTNGEFAVFRVHRKLNLSLRTTDTRTAQGAVNVQNDLNHCWRSCESCWRSSAFTSETAQKFMPACCQEITL